MTKKTPEPHVSGRMPVHLPVDLKPTYVNFALITNSRSEIVIDLAQVMPQIPQARVQTRVVMTALNAKLLLRALGDHMARFESQHGEIELPKGNTLADQLFKSHTDENDEEGTDEKP
ncbi:MAG TPA: DUF3467 domain-containing protein [Anaerolineales bacterium]|nr:DUF3467 domain-containing protein [Anaerolineales bacterium]